MSDGGCDVGVVLRVVDRSDGVFARTLLFVCDHVGDYGVSVCVFRESFRRADRS